MKLRKITLAVMLISITPVYCYADYAGNTTGENLLNDPNLTKITYNGTNTNLLTNGQLIPKDSGGNTITSNNVVVVDYDSNQPSTTAPSAVYGGYFSSSSSDASVKNTYVIVNNGKVNGPTYGAYMVSIGDPTSNHLMKISSIGNVYLNNNSSVAGVVYGAIADGGIIKLQKL